MPGMWTPARIVTPTDCVPTPTLPGLPVLGSALGFRRDPLGTLTTAARTGDVVRVRALHETFYVLSSPEAVRHVWVTRAKDYSRQDNLEVPTLRPTIGDGPLTSDGPGWLASRRAAQAGFCARAVAVAAGQIADAVAAALDAWPIGQVSDAFPRLLALSTDASLRGLLGYQATPAELGALTEGLLRGQEAACRRIANPLRRLPAWLKLADQRILDRTRAAADVVVDRSLATRGETLQDGDLLAALLTHAEPGTLRDQVRTAVIAAPENVASTLSWALYLLGRTPDVAARLHDEVTTVLAGRTPTLADMPRLTYTRAVLAETLRLYPGAPVIDRRALVDDRICGHFVPRGAIAVASPFVMQRDPRYWADPEAFRPERFLTGDPGPAYFPFGVGPRRCVGERFGKTLVEIALPMLVQRIVFSRRTPDPVEVHPLINLRPAGGVMLHAARRGELDTRPETGGHVAAGASIARL